MSRPSFAPRVIARASSSASTNSDSNLNARARRDDATWYRASGYRTTKLSDVERTQLQDGDASYTVVKVDVGPVTAYTGGRYDGQKVAAPWASTATTPATERRGQKERAYVFDSSALDASDGAPSTTRIVSVTSTRPLGIIFEPDARGRIRVADFVRGSDADKAASVARLSPVGADCARRGDVLRAFTATQVSFTTTGALLGDLSGTKRVRTLYGCDGESWERATAALTNGRVADGPVTLVLERLADADATERESWAREEREIEFRGLGEKTTVEVKRERAREIGEPQTAVNASILVGALSFLLLIAAGFT
mmetsp:Transcript_1294/g.4073  ORF Transcript_1294/g.4073 Transcript_1294/m.4073 type:complete len:311 (-) Transcript_1294:1792-2724(-)